MPVKPTALCVTSCQRWWIQTESTGSDVEDEPFRTSKHIHFVMGGATVFLLPTSTLVTSTLISKLASYT